MICCRKGCHVLCHNPDVSKPDPVVANASDGSPEGRRLRRAPRLNILILYTCSDDGVSDAFLPIVLQILAGIGLASNDFYLFYFILKSGSQECSGCTLSVFF